MTTEKKYDLTPVRVSEKIYDLLRERILNNEFPSGEPIVVSKLADSLNISRTPVREAIQKLESENWIGRDSSGRIYVIGISFDQVKNFYAVRATLEGLAAREATLKLDDLNRKRIETQFADYLNNEHSIEQIEENSQKSTLMGKDFHQLVQELANNDYCSELIYKTNCQILRYRAYTASRQGRDVHAIKEHIGVMKYILAGDADAAEKAMRQHILQARDMLVNASFEKQ